MLHDPGLGPSALRLAGEDFWSRTLVYHEHLDVLPGELVASPPSDALVSPIRTIDDLRREWDEWTVLEEHALP